MGRTDEYTGLNSLKRILKILRNCTFLDQGPEASQFHPWVFYLAKPPKT